MVIFFFQGENFVSITTNFIETLNQTLGNCSEVRQQHLLKQHLTHLLLSKNTYIQNKKHIWFLFSDIFFKKNHITVWYCCISCWLQTAWYPVSVMFHSGHYQCKSVWEHCGYLYELIVKHYSAFTSPLSGGFDCFYRLAGLCVDFHTTISYVLWV